MCTPTSPKSVAGFLRYSDELTTCAGHSFWQEDGFDHLVRSPEQLEHYRRYIANNPVKARLKSGEYILHTRPLP